MTEELDKYVREHTSTEGDYLYRLYRATNIHTIHGRMASGHLQGRLLKMLVEMVQPQNVLEVGTFSGYSALCLAEGLPEGAHLYTFEINDEMEDFTRPWIEGSPYADKISFIIGDANEKAPELGVTFDMAFVDGDKRTYVETYEMVLALLRPALPQPRRLYPGRQHALGRTRHRPSLRPRPADAWHTPIQRLCGCRRTRGAAHTANARRTDADS